jgi:hypothetical protein
MKATQHSVLHDRDPQIIETMKDLQTRVTTFRNKAIEHTKDGVFIWGIMPNANTCQVIGFPAKSSKNPKLSEPLLPLLNDLEKYMLRMLYLFEKNREVSILSKHSPLPSQ